ncbi:MAG: hypothetical protein QOE77_2643 [Blastocatellia bacterium]|jgi:hypothetical protein|nr:hypothetical protein [Blastocatellia bacterium]
MKKLRSSLNVLAILVCITSFASLAHAQASRTWVSGVGDDVNPCSRTAPCKTFSGAISKTSEGGEIDVLDPAGYGTLTITKAITVDGGTGSGWASVLASGLSGMTVNVTTGTHVNDAVVILRNITFNGISQSPSAAGTNGVNYLKAAQLHIENCVFENFSTTGITANLGTVSGALTVQDCVFDNVNTAVLSNATSPAINVLQFEHNRVVGSSNGLNASTQTFANVRDCYFGGLTGANGAVRAGTGSQVNVESSMFTNNNIGANVAGGTVRLSNSDFFNNTTAISGTAESANNNKFRANGADGATSLVIVVK